MTGLNLLFSNKVLLSAVFSWFIAQFLKIIIEFFKNKKLKTKEFLLRALFGTGGMPSSHSSTITAVTTYIGLKEGFNSSLFALSLVMVIIVIRDATGVRLSAGKQAKIINELLNDRKKRYNIDFESVKEVKGHTPLESLIGAIVGILIALGIFYFK